MDFPKIVLEEGTVLYSGGGYISCLEKFVYVGQNKIKSDGKILYLTTNKTAAIGYAKPHNKNSVIKNKLSEEDLYKILLLTTVITNTLSTVVETKKHLIKSITLMVTKRKGFDFGSIFDDSPKDETLNKSDIITFLKKKITIYYQ